MKPRLKWLPPGGLLITVVVLSMTGIPLGVPGEWQWSRHAFPDSIAEWVDRLIGPLISFSALIAVWWTGSRALQTSHPRLRWWMLPMLFAGSFVCMAGLRSAAPAPHRYVKGHWIIYDQFASGYFSEAAFEINSADELLAGYEDRMQQGDVLHEGTHPPGLYLLSWWSLKATAASPSFSSILALQRDGDTESAFRQLEASARLHPRLNSSQLSALTLISIATQFAMALTPLAVLGLCALAYEPRLAWQAACLAMTVPALQVFFPKSDVIFAATSTTFIALSAAAFLLSRQSARTACSLAASLTLFAGMLLSLAHLPALMVTGVFGFLLCCRRNSRRLGAVLSSSALIAMTFLALCVTWQWMTDCSLLNVWRWNLTNHAGFYDQYPRTYWKWLLVNPVEFGIGTGLPIFLLGICGWFAACRRRVNNARIRVFELSTGDGLAIAFAVTFAALWLSGRNSGEAARLWCLLCPWVIVSGISAVSVGDESAHSTDQTATDSRNWLPLITCQFACAVCVVGVVNGFLQL